MAASGPPSSSTSAARSAARLIARRTRMSSNGGRRTLRNIRTVAGPRAAVQPARGARDQAARRRRATGEGPAEPRHVRAAALDRRGVRLEASRAGVDLISIRSANPAGRAAVGRKWGLRTSTPPRRRPSAAMRYGPVPGGGEGRTQPCAPAYRGARRYAKGSVSLWQELRVGRSQVDGDRPRVRIRFDAPREVAAPARSCSAVRRRSRRRRAGTCRGWRPGSAPSTHGSRPA